MKVHVQKHRLTDTIGNSMLCIFIYKGMLCVSCDFCSTQNDPCENHLNNQGRY